MRLCECWMPLIERATLEWGAHHAAQAEAQDAAAASPTAWYVAQLDAAAVNARGMGFDDALIEAAEFAVVAWLDECAMLSSGAGTAAWRRAPLQRLRFGTTLAGQQFFERLDALPEHASAAREVYALMMLAGFRGEYTHRPHDAWTARREALLERVRTENGASKTPSRTEALLPRDAALSAAHRQHYGSVNPLMRLLRPLRALLLIAAPLLAALALYALGNASLSHQVDALLRTLPSPPASVVSNLPS
ncbi:MAG: DotU family type IV/VI secretion system protein [Janthinobacterium lividum]